MLDDSFLSMNMVCMQLTSLGATATNVDNNAYFNCLTRTVSQEPCAVQWSALQRHYVYHT